MKILKQPKTLTIDCKKWARGGKKGKSYLLNTQGNMCCLGFDALACGMDRKMIRFVCTPSELPWREGYLLAHLSQKQQFTYVNTGICSRMISVNDDDSITDTARMTKLTVLFSKIGVRVRFINQPKGLTP